MGSKPFYSMEEVCEKLGKTPDDVKGLVRDGTLREFRDAGKVFFKADEIEKLAGPVEPPAAEDTGDILLEPAAEEPEEADELPSLADSSGGTSIIGLEPLEEEKEEEKQEDTVITASGIGVFDDDELEIDADPMAKTQITSSATDDQVSLEGAGSGSGLLDLAREADDTALGADLLDEIYPGEEETTQPAEEPPAEPAEQAEEPEAVEEAEEAEAALEESEAGEVVAPIIVSTGDPVEGLFSGLMVGVLVLMAVATTVVAGVVQGYLPDYGQFLSNGSNFYYFLGGAAGLAIIGIVAGWFLGKAFAPRRR